MAMDFKAAQKRVRGLLAPKKASQLSRSALTPDPLRDRVIEDAGRTSERYQAVKREAPILEYEQDGEPREFEWTTFGEAVEDYARAAFGFRPPEILSRDKVQPSHRLNREVLHASTLSESFRKSYPYTSGNEAEALFGAQHYAEALVEHGRELLAEHVERSNQIGEAEQQQQTADEMFESLRQRAREENQQHGTVQKGTRREIKQALQAQANANANLTNLMQQQSQSGMPLAAMQAGKAAAAAAEEAVDRMQGLAALTAGMDPGSSQHMTPDQQIALAEKWSENPILRKVLANVGRMIRAMHFARDARVKNVPAEPVGMRLGNDLERVIPHELARAVNPHPLIQATFMRDFANHALLEWELEGKEPAGKGDLIEIHDGSGSMMSARGEVHLGDVARARDADDRAARQARLRGRRVRLARATRRGCSRRARRPTRTGARLRRSLLRRRHEHRLGPARGAAHLQGVAAVQERRPRADR
jgi:hypothetical protein